MRAITGCFRTTAITAMEYKTALLSPQWRLMSKILRTITRMATAARNHPIHIWIRAAKHGGPPYLSNTENLIKHYPEYIQPGLEYISPYIRPPWWSLTVSIEISPLNKDQTVKAHEQRLQQIARKDLVIYTDGSGHHGHIGAALYSPTINMIHSKYIVTDYTHNVYRAELTAIQMAISLIEKRIDEYSNAYIFVDS